MYASQPGSPPHHATLGSGWWPALSGQDSHLLGRIEGFRHSCSLTCLPPSPSFAWRNKLLILQALRERLPRATFFTTDLDARLTDPDVYGWSRNLIIGSPYGLAVSGLNGAGFRGSYQTALYRAVTLALERQYDEEPPLPRLFEIGRTGPIDITKLDGDCEANAYTSVHGRIRHIRSRSTRMRHIGSVLFVLAPLIALTIFSFLKSRVLHDKRREIRRKAHSRVSMIGALILFITAPAVYWWKTSGYEPWPYFEGINTQPTIILYLTTVVYAWALILIMLARINQEHRNLNERFGLPVSTKRSKLKLRKFWEDLLRRKRYAGPWIWIWRHKVSGVHETVKSVQRSWEKYLMYHQFRWQLVRVIIPVVVVLIPVSMYIWQGSAMSGPLLTQDIYYLLRFAEHLAIAALVFTVFFCSDTLNVGRALLRELSRHRLIEWPRAAKKRDDISGLTWTMHLLERYTECVRPVAVRPFILMFLLILARSSVLEGWVWTPEVVLFYTGLSMFVLVQAVRFQFEAVHARDSILSSLDKCRHKNWDNSEELSRIEITRDTINGMNKGVFVPWTRQPIFQALMLPVGAYGVVILLDTIF